MTGVELMGFDKDSDREALDSILQEVWRMRAGVNVLCSWCFSSKKCN